MNEVTIHETQYRFARTIASEHCPVSAIIPRANEHLLICHEEAKQFLQKAKSLEEVSIIRDKAYAVRMYAKQRNPALETINDAAMAQIRPDRRIVKQKSAI